MNFHLSLILTKTLLSHSEVKMVKMVEILIRNIIKVKIQAVFKIVIQFNMNDQTPRQIAAEAPPEPLAKMRLMPFLVTTSQTDSGDLIESSRLKKIRRRKTVLPFLQTSGSKIVSKKNGRDIIEPQSSTRSFTSTTKASLN